MDTRGNIAHFETDPLAEQAGYTTRLSEEEAKSLLQHPTDKRHAELKKLRYARKHKRADAKKRKARKAQKAARKKNRG